MCRVTSDDEKIEDQILASIRTSSKLMEKFVTDSFAQKGTRTPEEHLIKRLETMVDDQGLLLERQAARALREVGFDPVENNFMWQDPEGDHAMREGDVQAWREYNVENTSFQLGIVAECKRAGAPWLFAIDDHSDWSIANRVPFLRYPNGERKWWADVALKSHPFIASSEYSIQSFVFNK